MVDGIARNVGLGWTNKCDVFGLSFLEVDSVAGHPVIEGEQSIRDKQL